MGEGKGRTLVTPIQKGPFGPRESLTIIYTEDIDPDTEGEQLGLGGLVVVTLGEQKTGFPLVFDNELPLVERPRLLWVNGEVGWMPVVKIQREGPDGPIYQNQAFTWNGKDFVHSELEPRIADLDLDHEIEAVFH